MTGPRWTAGRYERVRPGYPDAVADLLTGVADLRATSRVLDVGAGTGKLTRTLTDRSPARVLAVEPQEDMRRTLRTTTPRAGVVGAAAEALPVAASSVDLVTVAQAWHWMDGTRALFEFARVLVPDGVAAVVWNTGDHEVDWVRVLDGLLDRLAAREPATARITVDAYQRRVWAQPFAASGSFTELEHRAFANPVRMRPSGVIELVASSSLVEGLTEAERDVFLGDVRDLLDTHPATRRRSELVYPYTTDVFWARHP